jgi:uncharacterized membrane protein YhaH (DUF805 family)
MERASRTAAVLGHHAARILPLPAIDRERKMNWYVKVLKQYVDFSGRAQRMEFWMFALINYLIMFGLYIIDIVLGLGFLGALYALGVLLPSIAVGVRRLHDTNRAGWWLLLGLIPLIGAIVLLVFFIQDSQPGANEYGPNPKGATA